MTQTRIEIEEHQFDRWVATVEGGTGVDVRRALVRATSFDGIIRAVVEAHMRMRPVPSGFIGTVPTGTLGQDVGPVLAVERASSEREALLAEGEAMGLTIDRRWGEYRLREVVEGERARRAL